jgi:hypothetical protein
VTSKQPDSASDKLKAKFRPVEVPYMTSDRRTSTCNGGNTIKQIGVISTTALLLLLGITAPADARQEKQDEKAKPAKQEHQARPEKQQRVKPPQQQHQQQQQQAKGQQRPATTSTARARQFCETTTASQGTAGRAAASAATEQVYGHAIKAKDIVRGEYTGVPGTGRNLVNVLQKNAP